MEKQTLHIPTDMTPRRSASGQRQTTRSTSGQRQTASGQRTGSIGSSGQRPQGSSGNRRPMSEAERRRRLAIRKRRRRKRMIQRAIVLAVLAILVILLIVLISWIVKTVSGKSLIPAKEPEMVEVQEFIGLNDYDGGQASVMAFGTYGPWLRLQGSISPAQGKTLSAVHLELHEAYETLLVPVDELTPETETEEKKGLFSGFGKKKEETETETETETEAYVSAYRGGVASYPMIYEMDELGNVFFATSREINGGIALDSMKSGTYTCLLHAVYTDGSEERLTFADASGMADIDYFTLTKNGSNEEVKLGFLATEDESTPYLLFDKQTAALPADVYDIVIDAGHGGMDPGASNDQLTEAELTLIYAKGVAEKLSAMGYKVFLTRDGTESADEDMAYTMYDENGRVNKACGSHAKLSISIHFNSNREATAGGLEVYCSGRGNTEFAALMADTIVAEAGATYSGQQSYQAAPGVYVKTYTEEQINDSNQKAANNNFAPYNLTTDTDYLYMIRELGGIWTNAYIDGRNPYYGENLYRNSNAGLEAYLIEMAFMSVASDIQNAVQNADAYEQGLADAIQTWANGLSSAHGSESATDVPAADIASPDAGDASGDEELAGE